MINTLIPNEIEKFNRETNEALGRIFSGKIKKSFLLKIKEKVKVVLYNNDDISKYFDFNFSAEKLVSGNLDSSTIDYEICKYIVGCHRANMIFVSNELRVNQEKNSQYIDVLVNNVVEHIKLRPFAGKFFRKQPIMRGENFIYFPLPYDLFAISINAIFILHNNVKKQNMMYFIFSQIFNKGLAALAMLEDNFLDNTYPICRGAIELYLKMLLILNRQETIDKYFEFSKFEVEQSCCGQKYSKEFNELFDKRINKNYKNKVDFLHFGWVDEIKDYHQIVKQKPYSINGVVKYLNDIYDGSNKTIIDNIKNLYKMCHGYTHGNIQYVKYPLINYFEISMMLYYVLTHTYEIICDIYSAPIEIDNIDILEKANNDFNNLMKQHSIRSTENFENYYNQQFNNM